MIEEEAVLLIEAVDLAVEVILGQVFLVLGRYEEAETKFRKSVKMQPDFYHSLINLRKTYLARGQLDRLQIAVAPVVIGDGRPGLQLPPSPSMGECLRPRHRVFRMGEDILFDCEPMPKAAREEAAAAGVERLV